MSKFQATVHLVAFLALLIAYVVTGDQILLGALIAQPATLGAQQLAAGK